MVSWMRNTPASFFMVWESGHTAFYRIAQKKGCAKRQMSVILETDLENGE